MIDAAAWHASDATTQQNMRCNQNDNETMAQHASDATADHNMHHNQNDNEITA